MNPSTHPTTHASTLLHAPIGSRWRVAHITPPIDAPLWANWLDEIGFVVGETVEVKRKSWLRRGALVVGVGLSTFALLPREAECIHIVPLTEAAAS